MAYSEDSLKAKLSTLNETQDSIVAVSQWILFYKRHADKIANFWLTRLRDSPPVKRLNFLYLVNDIVQNSRAKKRTEFPDAFSPLMPEACQTAYRSSTPEIQTKIRRLIEVWKQRNVFEAPILEAVTARLDDVDKAKGSSGKKSLMGKSLYSSSSGSSMPKELETLGPLQTAVAKATTDARQSRDTAEREYTQLNNPEIALPPPPVYAARLSGLIKSLAAAESAVGASIKARQALVADIERILESNKKALKADDESLTEMGNRKAATEVKKREVEDSIMRGLSAENTPELEVDAGIGMANGKKSNNFAEERPEVEELTPEPEDQAVMSGAVHPSEDVMVSNVEPSRSPPNPSAVAAVGQGFGDTATTSRIRVASSGSLNTSSAKRRKMSHEDDNAVPDLGNMGMDGAGFDGSGDFLADLDADVDELLKQEGGGSF